MKTVTITETEYATLKASNDEARRIARERDKAEELLRSVVKNVPIYAPAFRTTYLGERCVEFLNRYETPKPL